MILPSPFHRGRPPRIRDVRLYFTKRWKRFRKRYVEEHPFCVQCLEQGKYTPTNDVDHIIEIRDGGLEYEESNLQALCKRHHSIKTAKEARRRRQQPTGGRS